MPLPPEILEDIKKRLDESEAAIKDIGETISDLRAAGIDASKQEERLREVKETARSLSVFYERQSKRTTS